MDEDGRDDLGVMDLHSSQSVSLGVRSSRWGARRELLPQMTSVTFELGLPPELKGWLQRLIEGWDRQEASNDQRFYGAVDHGFKRVDEELRKIHEFLAPMARELQRHSSWEPHLQQLQVTLQNCQQGLDTTRARVEQTLAGIEDEKKNHRGAINQLQSMWETVQQLSEKIVTLEGHRKKVWKQ